MSKLLDGLNPAQREAVTHTIGPLLIIAGPGSGKTRTVVHSIAYAIENGVMPEQILAFSFTVKASEELRDRVKEIVGEEKGYLVNISTFHSFCRQVLREDIDKLGRGYARNFRALEENDQRKIVKNLARINEQRVRAEIEHIQSYKFPNPDEVLNFIKKCKAKEISPSDAGPHAHEFHRSKEYIKIYESYEQFLKTKGWIDYESQQLFTEELFRNVPEVKTKWQDKFKLIFVDEYQDTDPIQYRIVKKLAEPHRNLRVVGDDDQGIYGWRGADIQNILNFEKNYPNAKVISLGQNYRSTKKIVAVSRALAEFNPDRRDKELFTRNFEGEKVKYLHCDNDEEEAATIASFIQRSIDQGNWQPSDFAVLYRTNKQAYAFKTALSDLGIRYHVVGNSLDVPTVGISIMTIHKSKGLEFPNVFVTGICQDLLPHYYNSDEKDWGEELRLLYVAMTRAKNWLCLSSYEEEGKFQRKRGRSPFLERGYIPSSLLESVETLESVRIPPSPPEMTVPVTTGETAEYVEPLPEKLLGDGMTVTEARCGLSRAYLKEGNLAAAKSAVEEALKLKDEHPPARKLLVDIKMKYYNNGKIYFNHEQYNQAIFEFQQAIEIDQNFKDAHRFIGEVYLKLEYLEEAEKGAREALGIDPNYELAKELLEKIKRKHKEHGDDYRKKKAFTKALTSYQQAIRIDDKYKEAYHNLGILYRRMKKYDKAITAYQRVIDIDERSHVTYSDFSFVYREIGETAKAVSLLKRAIEIKPDYQRAYYNLADTYFEMENLQDASETILEALRFDANDQNTLKLLKNIQHAYLKQGRDYFRQGDPTAAENSAKQALTLDSNYQPAHKLLNEIKQTYYEQGLVYIENSAHAEAISALQKTVEIDPDFKEAHYSLGEIYFTIGDLEAAEKEVGKVLRIDAQDGLASCLLISIKEEYYKRGLTSLKQNEWKAAEKSAEEALRIDRNYKLASILLKNAYCQRALDHERSERYHRSINLLQKAEDIHPNCEKTHYYLGRVYFKIGRLKEAQAHVNKALSIQPNYPPSQKLLKEIKDARNWLKLGGKQVRRLVSQIAKRIGS